MNGNVCYRCCKDRGRNIKYCSNVCRIIQLKKVKENNEKSSYLNITVNLLPALVFFILGILLVNSPPIISIDSIGENAVFEFGELDEINYRVIPIGGLPLRETTLLIDDQNIETPSIQGILNTTNTQFKIDQNLQVGKYIIKIESTNWFNSKNQLLKQFEIVKKPTLEIKTNDISYSKLRELEIPNYSDWSIGISNQGEKIIWQKNFRRNWITISTYDNGLTAIRDVTILVHFDGYTFMVNGIEKLEQYCNIHLPEVGIFRDGKLIYEDPKKLTIVTSSQP